MPNKSFTIKRPRFYDYFALPNESTRPCSQEGCDGVGEFIGGHYLVKGKWVRVWVCKTHRVKNPLQELPTPQWILDGIKIEDEHADKMGKFYRSNGNLDADHGVSVKIMVSTGAGKYIPTDRVKSWRWGA